MSVEHELVRRALDGDGQAYAQLVRPHLSTMYRITVRACGNASLAEDAVQEALTLGYQQLSKYEPGTSLKNFLISIAVKRAHTLLRGERRRKAREDASDEPSNLATPAELLSAERAGARIREVLAKMPEKRRAAALLRLDGGMSYAEIAESVGTTEGSARVLVHLAMKELREHLKDMLEVA